MIKVAIFLILVTQQSISEKVSHDEGSFELSVIHFNDFHARYEETTIDSGRCKSQNCIGGFSRLYETIVRLINAKPESLLLNAGDNFEGTVWYEIFKWNVTQYFLNKLPTDAYTLGNHEFQEKISGLVPFLQNINAPVVLANVDTSAEPEIELLINKSTIIQRNGKKIGIIGVLLSTIDEYTDIGNLVLLDEAESVNKEAERLVNEEGVFTNIVLSHCGYDVELEIARKSSSKISLIVGGHTHTFLYTGENPPGPDIPSGDYPTIIKNRDNKTVLVVQASSYAKYIGNISLIYDDNGEILDWSGRPIYLNSKLPQNDEINAELLLWKEELTNRLNDSIIGSTLVRLDQSKCFSSECLLGNFVTDAMVFEYAGESEPGSWSYASLAVFHAAALRSGIDIGNITYTEIVMSSPFKNTIDVAEIKGNHLKEVFEASINSNNINMLQVSGIEIVYDLTRDEGSKVASLKLRCQQCDVPVFEEIDLEQTYRIIVPSFIADGGFGFTLFKDYLKNRKIGDLDTNVFVRYLKAKSPVFQQIENRINIIKN